MSGESGASEALFGFENGAPWVADDVFVTRCEGGTLMVERLDGQGVCRAHVRRNSEGFMQAIWAKLNEVAMNWPSHPGV